MKSAILLAALALPAAAADHDTETQGPSTVLLDALRAETARTVARLKLAGLPDTYFVGLLARESRRMSVDASFGGARDPHVERSRTFKLDLRVGARDFDNEHYAGAQFWEYDGRAGRLPLEDDADAIRASLWREADRAYKQAVERLAQKRAYKEAKNLQEILPDLSTDPVEGERAVLKAPGFDVARWEAVAREASAVFKAYPKLRSGSVGVYFTIVHDYIVDSEGREVVKPRHDYDIRIEAGGQAADGMHQGSGRRFLARAESDLPAREALVAAARAVAEEASALTAAPQAASYIGPVLFEDQAAGEFFNQLFASGVSYPREVWIEDERARKHMLSGALKDRLGFRVLAPLFDAWDDPLAEAFEGRALLGHYRFDDQGIRARRVDLVEKGILKDVLMSRSPIKERARSNGHGRGGLREKTVARVGNLFLRPNQTAAAAEMRRRLLAEAKAFGLDHAVIIRRMKTEGARDEGSLLAPPALAYSVDVETGKETLLRDAEFTNTTHRSLRDVIAASEAMHVYNYYQLGPYRYAREEVQASIVHPSVLLSEMELKKTDKKPEKPPYLARPSAR